MPSGAWFLFAVLAVVGACAAPKPEMADLRLPSGKTVHIVDTKSAEGSGDANCPEPQVGSGPTRNQMPPSAPPTATSPNPKPIHVQPPLYPACAESKGVNGIVDLVFTIQPDGSVADPKVVRETPEGYGFAAAALAVFPQWKFPPKVMDGKAVALPAGYRLTFRLEAPESSGPPLINGVSYPRLSDLETAGLPVARMNPKFPAKAENQHKEGFVDLEFTLLPDGSVSDVAVIQEAPLNFGFAANGLAVITHWKFPPKTVDGKPVAKRVQYRMSFKLARK